MRILKALIVLCVVVAGVSFAWLNAQPVPFNYYVGTVETRLALLLVGFLAGGWVLGVLSMVRSVISLRRRLARADHELKLSRREVGNLRNLPLRDGD